MCSETFNDYEASNKANFSKTENGQEETHRTIKKTISDTIAHETSHLLNFDRRADQIEEILGRKISFATRFKAKRAIASRIRMLKQFPLDLLYEDYLKIVSSQNK